MTNRRDAKLVFSTSIGRVCPGCGWPANDWTCSKTTAIASIPSKLVAELRMETGPGVSAVRTTEHTAAAPDGKYAATITFSTVSQGGREYRYFDKASVARR